MHDSHPQIEALHYTYAGFNIAASMLGGHVVTLAADNSLSAAANVGGGQLRNSSDPNFNSKDFQVYAKQFIGKEGAVSALYYHGTVSIPVPGATTPTSWTDSFDRAAVYATVPVIRSDELAHLERHRARALVDARAGWRLPSRPRPPVRRSGCAARSRSRPQRLRAPPPTACR